MELRTCAWWLSPPLYHRLSFFRLRREEARRTCARAGGAWRGVGAWTASRFMASRALSRGAKTDGAVCAAPGGSRRRLYHRLSFLRREALRAAPAHQSALRRRRRRRPLGWGDGAVRLGLDRDLPRSQRTRRRRAARAGRFLGVVRGMEPEGFARTYMLGFCMELGAVCGREEIAVDRWYHHLLVFLLVFLLSLHAHSLWLLKCTHTDSRRAVSGATATNRGSEHLAVATGRHPGGP